jgi:FixJ family two-component response regulator
MDSAAGLILQTMPEKKEAPLIAIVDDEACVREALSSLLRSEGYRTEEFDSTEGFLARGIRGETTCLVLDVRLPKMGGLELQRRLAEMARSPIPIVFISGNATEKEAAIAIDAGAIAFLRKPFSDDALLKAVESGTGRAAPEMPSEFYFLGLTREDLLRTADESLAGALENEGTH